MPAGGPSCSETSHQRGRGPRRDPVGDFYALSATQCPVCDSIQPGTAATLEQASLGFFRRPPGPSAHTGACTSSASRRAPAAVSRLMLWLRGSGRERGLGRAGTCVAVMY